MDVNNANNSSRPVFKTFKKYILSCLKIGQKVDGAKSGGTSGGTY